MSRVSVTKLFALVLPKLSQAVKHACKTQKPTFVAAWSVKVLVYAFKQQLTLKRQNLHKR